MKYRSRPLRIQFDATTILVLIIAGISVTLQCLASLGWHGYGYFGDELYFLACTRHLDAGYVDQPPLSVWLLAGWRWLFGEGLVALRMVPALAGGATIVVTAWMAKAWGGGRRAQIVAAFATACMPMGIAVTGYYSMNALELLLWTAAAAVFVSSQRDDRPRLWIVQGALLGLALLNKHTAVLWVIGLLAGLLVSPSRRQLATRWPWLGLALAGVVTLPNLVWQVAHGFPSAEFYAQAQQMHVAFSPMQQLGRLVLYAHPVLFPLWIGGLLWLLSAKHPAPYRPLGVIVLVWLAVVLVSHTSRIDRLAGALPMLYAAGAVACQHWLRRAQRQRAGVCLSRIAGVLMIGVTCLALPTVAPILPPPHTVSYLQALRLDLRFQPEHRLSALPPLLAGRLGWPDLVATVTAVYQRLTPEERAHASLLTASYSQASALDILGRHPPLPPARSAHIGYSRWSAPHAMGDVVITVDLPESRLRELFAEVRTVATVRSPYAMVDGAVICLARHPKVTGPEFWARLHHNRER